MTQLSYLKNHSKIESESSFILNFIIVLNDSIWIGLTF
jgi:hypothetical protein